MAKRKRENVFMKLAKEREARQAERIASGTEVVTCPEQMRAFLHRCEDQIYNEGIDLDDDARLRLFRLSGHHGEPPNYRAAWPPYAGMIEDARKALTLRSSPLGTGGA